MAASKRCVFEIASHASKTNKINFIVEQIDDSIAAPGRVIKLSWPARVPVIGRFFSAYQATK